MGFWDRLYDFGDREQVKTVAMRIDIGLQQLEEEQDIRSLRGLCTAIRQDIEMMMLLASKLSVESLGCLKVRYKGDKISYFSFLNMISQASEDVQNRGGHSLI